ncbi:MAG TPA: AAA family ATPase [Streptomyces sp.]
MIIHGPNGVGKTKLLELVSAVAWPVDFSVIVRTPFEMLRLEFGDGSVFTVDKMESADLGEVEIFPPSGTEYLQVAQGLFFVLEEESGHSAVSWSPEELSRYVNKDRDGSATARLFDLGSAMARYSEDRASQYTSVPSWVDYLSDSGSGVLGDRIPEVMRDFLSDMVAHSIDTHRLLGLSSTTQRQGRLSFNQIPQETKVEQFAQDLARRLASELAENSRTSQELDRTYPQRLLETANVDVSESEIRERYDAQNDLRRRLGDISLVDDDERSSVIEIPERMEQWQRAVLWTYLRDTEDKLATFREVLDRVSLLRNIVNSRFLFNRLEIDRERGFRLVDGETKQELDLSSLSSGEQHELVLVYDLLFNVPPGALVLIDEPEISLHVSWQKSFISDLRRIASLVKFRTIVATHSPQIAGKWVDRMVVLGPAAE